MKKMLTFAAIAAVSTSAHAFDYKFGLEGRSDFISSTSKTEVGATTTKTKYMGFQSNLIRLSLTGNINENLTYKFRYRFNKTEATNTTRDNSTKSLDHLYVDHKNSLFTTRFGKTNWAEAYGRESFLSSTDLLITSAAYDQYNTNIGTYRFGVSGTYTFLDTNKITLAISNPNPELTDTTAATATNEKKNTSLAYAIHYSSVLFDKAFQPTLSYTTAKQDNDVKSAKNTMMAAGFRTEAISNLIVDADWKQFKAESQTNGGVDTKTSSIFANVAYNINEWSPFVQYINDKVKGAANSEYKKNSIAGGVMWKPFQDTNFRYHLAYTNANKKFDVAANGKVKDNIITFGIKADL
ncbi:hypothetical protein C0V70_00275 [Bacteriovorax stolpii]|uniref:Uncharacterized protein n=1 Tax=Bacteriovorax stolpii TaxID=960 RepID=A0A2K9NP67_BACTC|nr:porin [Bacteriovorax stolpii]AUN96564.1 hypothetical protein C0V70_00275 [Bacteriovorax stolpii]TDP53915.1 phosphate-selective porin O/P [Bacteriovorax stolpii]